jgi:hypothetical protein
MKIGTFAGKYADYASFAGQGFSVVSPLATAFCDCAPGTP